MAYFLVIFQSFLINSKIIFNTESDKTRFMKFIIFNLTTNSYAILEVKKKPYDDAEIEKIYKLDNK